MNTPLGKYTEIAAFFIAVISIAFAIWSHVFQPNVSVPFVDSVALVSVGAIFGVRAANNGYAAQANAAHKRLDKIGAPPANSETYS